VLYASPRVRLRRDGLTLKYCFLQCDACILGRSRRFLTDARNADRMPRKMAGTERKQPAGRSASWILTKKKKENKHATEERGRIRIKKMKILTQSVTRARSDYIETRLSYY